MAKSFDIGLKFPVAGENHRLVAVTYNRSVVFSGFLLL
jgi:hypothetical protein